MRKDLSVILKAMKNSEPELKKLVKEHEVDLTSYELTHKVYTKALENLCEKISAFTGEKPEDIFERELELARIEIK